MTSLSAVSFGGGRQTVAMLVLAATGQIPHRLFVFANVGTRAESPRTLTYLAEHAKPYAAANRIDLVELRWADRTGKQRDLYDDLLRQPNSLTIPLRDSSGFGRRKCTSRYKIEPVAREMKRRGATVDDPAEIALGISLDEIHRAHPGVVTQQPWTTRTYPLLDLGLTVADCLRIVDDAGLPQPPRSACSFCPFQRADEWRWYKQNDPERFARDAELDGIMRQRHIELRGDPAGLAHPTEPLATAIDDQMSLLGDCDGGWCMT